MAKSSSSPLDSASPSRSLSTHVIHSTASPSLLLDSLVILAIGFAAAQSGYWRWAALGAGALWLKAKTGCVLNESILAIAGLGLQLSTTRGIVLSIPTRSAPLRIPLSTSRLFLPLNSISDVVINEGIYGWTIIYYLVIIQDDGNGPVKLRVGFPELLPRLKELREVWAGVRSTLFDEEDGPAEEVAGEA